MRLEKACFGTTAWDENDVRSQFRHDFARITVFDDADGCGDGSAGAAGSRGGAAAGTSGSTSARSGGAGLGTGLYGYLLSWTTRNEVQLMRLGVHPDQQHKGIGSRLMSDLLEYAALCSEGQEGAKVTLEVRKSNERALNFYLLHGFTQVATRRNYYPDSEDAILMDRLLLPQT